MQTSTHVSIDGTSSPSVSMDGRESRDADAAERRRRSVRPSECIVLLMEHAAKASFIAEV